MLTLQTDSVSWADGADGLRLTVRTPRAKVIAAQLEPDREYDVEIKKHRKKRSLTANAYYWSLLTKLADALKAPTTLVHNLILRDYGQMERYGGKIVYVVLPDTAEAEDKAGRAETYHLKPTSQIKCGNDGQTYRTWMLLRGSSTYNTHEFSRLLDGLIEECKAVGIETMTPAELARLEGYDRG